MDLLMGAIHGFDSTSDQKSVSFTETRKCFPRFAAHLLRLVSSGRSGSGENSVHSFSGRMDSV
jgi:hypothetical protein